MYFCFPLCNPYQQGRWIMSNNKSTHHSRLSMKYIMIYTSTFFASYFFKTAQASISKTCQTVDTPLLPPSEIFI